MSERLYYSDSYTTEFSAEITESFATDAGECVVLAQSLFYPTTGGQPHDTGTIGDRNVVDVYVRESDEAVVHVLDGALKAGVHAAKIEWQRRFDHMQQHTGQHILSQAFIQLADAGTVGFHLGENAATIDLAADKLAPAIVAQAEALANKIVWENRPIQAYFVSKTDAASLPLRKVPDIAGDKLRIVNITDFDVTACGGTHTSATGGVGIIKVTKIERIRKQTRIEFRCGQRALRDYGVKDELARGLATDFTCSLDFVKPAVQKLRTDLKKANKTIKQQGVQLLSAESDQLLRTASTLGEHNLITKLFDKRDPGQMRQLANKLVREPNTIVLFGTTGSPGQLIFCRSAECPGEMNELIAQAAADLGGSGGGSAHFAQAGGLQATAAHLQAAIDEALTQLTAIV